MLVADLDDDGFADVAAALRVGTAFRVSVGLNDGTGTFPGAANYPQTDPIRNARGRWALAAADFNEDGFTDIVFTNSINQVTILFGDGNGVFNDPALPPVKLATLAEPLSVVAADFDLDGHVDIGRHRMKTDAEKFANPL